MDLEIPSTDRRLHTVPVATCLGEGPSDRGLRGAVETQDRSTPLRSALQHPPDGRGLECARPQALKLARRTGQHHDHGCSVGIEHEPGRRSRQPEGNRAFREASPAWSRRWRTRCTACPCARRTSARPSRSAARGPRPRRGPALRPARPSPRFGRHGSGRARPRRGRDRRPRPSASARSRSSGRSPTIVIRSGSRPSRSASAARKGPFRSFRSPRTSSDPVTTIAARGRDCVKRMRG